MTTFIGDPSIHPTTTGFFVRVRKRQLKELFKSYLQTNINDYMGEESRGVPVQAFQFKYILSAFRPIIPSFLFLVAASYKRILKNLGADDVQLLGVGGGSVYDRVSRLH